MKKILIVDDNADYRYLLRTALEKSGYEVDEAEDGITVEKIFFQKASDVIIMDLFLPKRDGIHAISSIKNKFSNIKIIAISGVSSIGRTNILLNKALEYGADITMTKPIKIEELLSNIKRLTNNEN
ncbi:MAG TPA: response regulator [Victivallales bacterium]|nr:response regulator [Victivallales bacterium]